MNGNLTEKVAALNLSDGMHEIEIEGHKAHVSKVSESLLIFTNGATYISADLVNM